MVCYMGWSLWRFPWDLDGFGQVFWGLGRRDSLFFSLIVLTSGLVKPQPLMDADASGTAAPWAPWTPWTPWTPCESRGAEQLWPCEGRVSTWYLSVPRPPVIRVAGGGGVPSPGVARAPGKMLDLWLVRVSGGRFVPFRRPAGWRHRGLVKTCCCGHAAARLLFATGCFFLRLRLIRTTALMGNYSCGPAWSRARVRCYQIPWRGLQSDEMRCIMAEATMGQDSTHIQYSIVPGSILGMITVHSYSTGLDWTNCVRSQI